MEKTTYQYKVEKNYLPTYRGKKLFTNIHIVEKTTYQYIVEKTTYQYIVEKNYFTNVFFLWLRIDSLKTSFHSTEVRLFP